MLAAAGAGFLRCSSSYCPSSFTVIDTGSRLPRLAGSGLISFSCSHGDDRSVGDGAAVKTKGSGTTARGRRLLKVREVKRKREYDRLHNYPAWAK